MFNNLGTFIKYLFGKSSEVGDLEAKDALLAKTVLDIHRKRTHSDFTMLPLFSLKQIHAIDRENALLSARQRVEILQNSRQELLNQKKLTREILDKLLPSVSGIKAVKQSDDIYIAYEGNGRLFALQQVFTPEDDIRVEVEEYHFRNQQKIIRRMNRVRRMNGLSD